MSFRVVIRQKSMDAVNVLLVKTRRILYLLQEMHSPLIETGISFLVPGKKMLDTPAK